MRSISELDLVVVIPLLAAKVRDMTQELQVLDARSDDLNESEIEDRCQLQDMLQQYHRVLDNLRAEYESALDERINLPSYTDLTARFLAPTA